MEEFFVVIIQQKRFLILQRNWIENPCIGAHTKVFWSPNDQDTADYTRDVKYMYNRAESACYEGFVLKKFNVFEEAEKYIAWKRPVFPVQYKTGIVPKLNLSVEEPVEYIDIASDSVSNDLLFFRVLARNLFVLIFVKHLFSFSKPKVM